jgi:tetratricopeptide (TPR) repeat protein
MEENNLTQIDKLIKLGKEYLDKGFFEFAIDIFTQAINLDPKYFDIYNLRGMAYGDASEFEDSIADFGVYIALHDDSSGYCNRGLSYWYNGMLDKAIDDFNTAIGKNPENKDYFAYRGFVWHTYAERDKPNANESLAKAIADCSKAIILGFNRYSVFECRGLAYLETGETEKALNDLNRALAIEPNDIDVQIERILALSKLKIKKDEGISQPEGSEIDDTKLWN